MIKPMTKKLIKFKDSKKLIPPYSWDVIYICIQNQFICTIQLLSGTKPNHIKYHIFGNQKERFPSNINTYLGVFIFSFSAIIFKVCYISCVTHFSSAQLLVIFFFLLSKWSFVSLLWCLRHPFIVSAHKLCRSYPLFLPPALHIIGVLFHACPTLLSIAFEVMLID